MWKLLQIELFKIYRRPRTYIAFVAIASLIGLIQLGLKVDGKAYMEFITAEFQNSFTIEGNSLNGYFVCYQLLNLLLIHVPLLIALIAADMISGEANMGTLRLLLTKPISRTEFILAKFIASAIYTMSLLIFLAALALFGSMLIFGTDDMLVLKNYYLVHIPENDVFWRYVGAFGFASLAMITVASLGFFLSLFAENSIGPIVATMSVIIVTTVLSTMSIPLFNTIKPYLFTTHMVTWKEFFDHKVDMSNAAIKGSIENPERIIRSVIVLAIHIVGFVGLSIWVFKKKDVLS